MSPPRLMTAAEVAAYLAITPRTLREWRAAGIVPGPIAGTTRWDRAAIDAAIDRRSGIARGSRDSEAGTAYDAWKEGRAG